MQMTSEDSIEVSKFTWPKGFYADSTHAGLKPDQDDMGWIYSETPEYTRPTSFRQPQLN